MANPNPNDTKIEQQRSDSAKDALKDQTTNDNKAENNNATDSSEKNK